ncbi:MAG: HAD-IA family hydrolase, partial [Clostridiales bacterium]|nr:HAD-IA family hydrolase [Clostridiales bacterium]
CIVTSKRKILARRGLEIFNLQDYFSGIIGYEDTDKHKPNPDPINKALSLLNAKPEEAIMIGDSVFDIKCAKNAGIKSAFVSWSEAGDYQDNIVPDYTIGELSQLLDII